MNLLTNSHNPISSLNKYLYTYIIYYLSCLIKMYKFSKLPLSKFIILKKKRVILNESTKNVPQLD